MSLASDMLKVLDVLVGRPLCVLVAPLAGAWSRADRSRAPERILVIRPGGIGDAVLFVPMLDALRASWPDARLDLLVERRNAGVVRHLGSVDRVLLYDRPGDLVRTVRGHYDLVVDTEQYHCLSTLVAAATRAPRRIGFGTNVRRRLLTETVPYDRQRYEALSFLELARLATGRETSWDPDRPFYPVPSGDERDASAWLAPLAGRPLVAIHPGASIPERRWPSERYAALARRLAEEGLGIVVLGGPTDVPTARRIESAVPDDRCVNVAGRASLADTAAIIAAVSVYVSADTGVLHIAYGVGTPTVHLFGPGVLSKWGPPGRRYKNVAHPTPCSPCTVYGYTPPCCQGVACMLGITPEQVFEAVVDQVRRYARPVELRADAEPGEANE
jgi:lipopolysaccharide heptosyltransferase II